MTTAAETVAPLITSLLGTTNPPVQFAFWDGSSLGPSDCDTRLVVRSPDAIRRILWSPNELGIGRAYVAGELDLEGDVFAAIKLRDSIAASDERATLSLKPAGWIEAARAAKDLGVLRRPLAPPPEEAHLRGRRHSKARDAAAIAHHYNVGNDFYRLILGPTMAYSCAYFDTPEATLEDAQTAKFDLVARKLGLEAGMRLLDVGCGWGGMVLHAAEEYGVEAVGITLATEQAELARKRVAEAGLADRIEIRVQDYRDVHDGPYDAISSIGMFEHVGLSRLAEYVKRLASLLPDRGRLLNHGISRPPGPSPFDRHSFIERYVFPDGELHEVGTVVSAIQEQGLEVRDVQSLREHDARTLRQWVANLEANWEEAVDLVGEPRAKVWRLYMAASAVNFEDARASIHQVLAIKPAGDGTSGMPATRADYAV